MNNFTMIAGYPYLNITRDGNEVTVTQERFMQTGQKWDKELVSQFIKV